MKIVTVVGARPQFIKAAPVSIALRESGYEEFFVHTGQHYDYKMSAVFFKELGLCKPHINLGVESGPHGWQTANILMGLEKLIVEQKPNWVLVYGDTNSTLAGALAAVKLHIPLAHVEAGLRSFNRQMPEEYNRIITDHCADLLFCPTQTAVQHLAHEGIRQGVYMVGDVMYEAILQYFSIARKKSRILQNLALSVKKYLLLTLHRPQNSDQPENIRAIFEALANLKDIVVFPAHPRTQKALSRLNIIVPPNVRIIDAVGYGTLPWRSLFPPHVRRTSPPRSPPFRRSHPGRG